MIKACFNANGIPVRHLEEADEIVFYFTQSRSVNRLNSIQFVQGMLPFDGVQEGYDSSRRDESSRNTKYAYKKQDDYDSEEDYDRYGTS